MVLKWHMRAHACTHTHIPRTHTHTIHTLHTHSTHTHRFEELCSDLLSRAKVPVENALRDAKLSMAEINEVILVGGSTRIPSVINVVRTMCGKEPNATVNPDEVVALGAAVQAGACGVLSLCALIVLLLRVLLRMVYAAVCGAVVNWCVWCLPLCASLVLLLLRELVRVVFTSVRCLCCCRAS